MDQEHEHRQQLTSEIEAWKPEIVPVS